MRGGSASGVCVIIRTAGLVSVVFLAGVFAACGAMEPASGATGAATGAPQVLLATTDVRPAATVEPLSPALPELIEPETPAPVVSVPALLPGSSQSGEMIAVSYKWFYRTEWTWETQIPRALYEDFKQLPRLRTTNYSVYVTHPADDYYLDLLVEEIKTAGGEAGFTGNEMVEFAAAFVQGLPYTVDSVTSPYDEYPRYPVETLVDGGGDCEDTSILLAAIVDKLGYGIVLIMLPEHVAVGIQGETGIEGTYYQYAGRDYYYLETTGDGFAVGELPEELRSEKASIYPMVPVAILSHDYQAGLNENVVEVEVTVHNLGTARAERVSVLAGFESGKWVLNGAESGYFSVDAGDSATVKLSVVLPNERHVRLLVQISDDDLIVDEGHSAWVDGE